MNQKQYNDKYKNVIYDSCYIRLYDERFTNSFDAFYSETQIKFIELIEKFNFKIFYVKSKAKSNLKIEFFDKKNLDKIDFNKINWSKIDLTSIYLNDINLNNNDVIKIKELLRDDLYYLYENKLFEVIYTIPKINENNNYYFDFILIVNQNFDLNNFYNYNFNINEILSISEINLNDITFDFIQNIFNKKVEFSDSFSNRNDKDYYDLSEIDLKYDDYIKNFCNNDESLYNLKDKTNHSSHIFYKNFNQNKYVKYWFKILDMQIWSFDRIHIKIINNKGWCYSYINEYEINSIFITNFFELAGVVSVNFKKENEFEIARDSCIYCCLSDNFTNQNIHQGDLSKNFDKNGFLILENVKIYNEEDIIDGQIIKK